MGRKTRTGERRGRAREGERSGEDRVAKAVARIAERVRHGGGAGSGGPGRGRGPVGASSRSPEFLVYYTEMIDRIRDAWVWAGDDRDLEVKVRFRITATGEIADLRVTRESGDPAYDESVLRALRAVRALAPPPAAYRRDFEDVELTFRPADLQSAPGSSE